MNLKIQFELKRYGIWYMLLIEYKEDKHLIDFGGDRYNYWINQLYERVIFDKQRTLKYYDNLINMEEEELEEEINKIYKRKKQLELKAIEEQDQINFK